MKQKIPEKLIQKQIIDYLKLKGFKTYRVNNAGVWNAKVKAFIWHGTAGVPDIIAMKKDNLLFIECKSSVGKMSLDQKDFLDSVNKTKEVHGICCHSLDELIEVIG